MQRGCSRFWGHCESGGERLHGRLKSGQICMFPLHGEPVHQMCIRDRYGSRYSVLADINEFTPEEIEILHSLWKESFLRRVPEENEKEQEKEMDRCV